MGFWGTRMDVDDDNNNDDNNNNDDGDDTNSTMAAKITLCYAIEFHIY